MSTSNLINVGISFKTVSEGLRMGLSTPTLVYNLIGYSGIGKTALVRQVVEELGGKVVEINSSLLQAGDLAMPVKHEDDNNQPIVKYVVNETIVKTNRDAKNDKDNIHVLFFDEFNRADAEVQSDLMNLILQRQLFDIVLEDNVRIVTAQNPDRTTEGFEHTNYDVHEVDEATASRVVDIRMRYSASDWLTFGTTYDKSRQRHNVHPMVTAYIANGNEDRLLLFNPDKRNTPSPRGWSRVGELFYDMGVEDLEGVSIEAQNFINEAITGIVGGDSAESFMSFAKTFTSYIKVNDWLKADEKGFDKLLSKYTEYDNTKKVLMVEDLIKYMLSDKGHASNKDITERVARVLAKAPRDTITNQLREIARTLNQMYKGETIKVQVGEEGNTREEAHTAGMVRYIEFVNSDEELKQKQRNAVNNSTVNVREAI